MDLNISEQQEIMLYKAVKDNNGVLSAKMAESMYSSKSTAHSAIDKLELAGYIERYTPGYWKVVKVTHDVKEEIKQAEEQEEQEQEEETESSEFEIKQK